MSNYGESAQYYETIYRSKDYAAEAAQVAEIIRARRPEAKTLLDVACGPHGHVRGWLGAFAVDGVDIVPEFVARAQEKNPTGRYVVGDMRDFDMGRRYDAVVCLFSAIGYLLTLDDLERGIGRMAAHLEPGGVLVVEPWWTPSRWKTGHISMQTAVEDDVKICRMSQCELEGDAVSFMRLHHVVGDASGVRHFTEDHRLRLSTVEEMTAAFERAGLSVAHDPDGYCGRGLYVARRPEAERSRPSIGA